MYLHGDSRPSLAPVQTINAISRIASRAIQGGFNRQACLPIVQEMLNATSSLASDTSFFYQDKLGHIYSDYHNPIIREDICVAQCGGSGMGWYPDSAARLLTWFIPGLFLISSIKLAPIGIRRFAMVAHLFGDPIHSYWSLLSKLEDWNKCYKIALGHHKGKQQPASGFWQFVLPQYVTPDKQARDTAVILAAIKELLPDANMREYFAAVNACSCAATNYNQIAGSIISSRTSGTITTWFAIGTYIFGIICAFVSVLGGSGGASGPSGGRIAPAMLLSWILPNILLNNEIGQVPKEACIRIVRQLEGTTNHQQNCNVRSNPGGWTSKSDDAKWKGFLNSQAWNGGIYSCQLQNPMLETGPRRHRSIGLVAIAVTSVCISFSIAFGVLYSYPTFLSCRNILFIAITAIWLLSPILSRFIMASSLFGKTTSSKWRTLLIKDSLIGFSIIFLLILSSCGLGNSCRCWAGFNNEIQGVVLNPGKQFTKNNTYVYPSLIAICLGLQYLVYKTALYVGRTGLAIMVWSEEDRMGSLPDRAVGREDESVGKADVRVVVDTLDDGYEERDVGTNGVQVGRYGFGLKG